MVYVAYMVVYVSKTERPEGAPMTTHSAPADLEPCERCAKPIHFVKFPAPDLAHNDDWFEPVYDLEPGGPLVGPYIGDRRHTPERCRLARAEAELFSARLAGATAIRDAQDSGSDVDAIVRRVTATIAGALAAVSDARTTLDSLWDPSNPTAKVEAD